jgi:hypothetical protein
MTGRDLCKNPLNMARPEDPRGVHTTTNPQLGLLDSLMPSVPGNDFLEKLGTALDLRPLERALRAMYPATTGRPSCAPLALFKMSLLQHCYGLVRSALRGTRRRPPELAAFRGVGDAGRGAR